MGCDIHLYTEYRKDGKWYPADAWVEGDRYNEGWLKWRVPYHLRPFDARDYDFFGWLANVRNGTWSEDFPVIFEPRGLPEDCCDRIRAESEIWDGVGHSHTYVTLGELEAHWNATKAHTINYHGAIDIRNPQGELAKWLAKEPRTTKPPGGYCASGTFCTPVHWTQTVGEEIGGSYHELQDYLGNVGFEYQVRDRENDVRAVFWFDN